jgi:hypothetical protein
MAINWASKIQALLANADDPSLSEATRNAYQAKAEQLMKDYRVAEEQALATDPGSSAPISRKVRVTTGYRAELDSWYSMVFSLIAKHTGCRVWYTYDNGDVATLVGYEGDVRYAEFLWTAALLMFSTRIDPVWDANLPEAENIWRLRNAGIERRVIADKAWGYGAGAVAANRSKVQRIYLRESATRGEEARATGLGHQTDVYRQAYARSFYDTLRNRLQTARDAADSAGGGLVLHGRSERVDEAFYGLFPHARPNPNPAPYTPPAPCPRCTDDKTCRKHAWTKADEAAWQRQHNSASARAGGASGRVAAEGVRIERGHAAPARVGYDTDADPMALEG